MGNGFGIAALIVLFLSLGIPIYGNLITLVALALVTLSAFGRSTTWPIAITAAAGVKLFFLSPSWMILMAGDQSYVWVTLACLATPILAMILVRSFGGRTAAPVANLVSSPAPLTATPPSVDTDVGDWDNISNKEDVEQLRAYLVRHPRGRFSELAALKLERAGITPPTIEAAVSATVEAAPVTTPEPAAASTGTRRPARLAPVVAIAVVLAVGGAAAFVALRGSSSETTETTTVEDPNAFVVLSYESGEVRLAREDGSRFRATPFARPDIPVLRETTALERLEITGWVNQPDGHWYQVRLADGR